MARIVTGALAAAWLVFFVVVLIPEAAKREAHREHIVHLWNLEHGYGP